MHSSWNPVQDRLCYGVATCNFEQGGHPLVLSIQLGEAVLIKGECEEWYYVKKFESSAEGILPKSYVHIKECSVIRNGEKDIVLPKQPTLAQEINEALREWYKIAKQLYVINNTRNETKQGKEEFSDIQRKFMTIRNMILNLHECRKRLLSNLTVEGLKELKKQVAVVIDSGNSLLKLDMVVRDENGNPLDPLSTSTVQLFRQHQHSSLKLKRSARGSQRGSRVFTHNSHSLIVTVDQNDINLKIADELELRFFLCDTKLNEDGTANPFTESVQITLRSSVPPKAFKFLFTDLGKSDFEKRDRIFLVTYVVRIGPMEFREPELKRDNTPFSDKRNNIQVKRPHGVAAKEITSLFKENGVKTTNEADKEIVPYLPCGGEDTLDDTLKKLLGAMKGEQNGQTSGKDTKSIGFFARLLMVPGTPQQIQEEQPVLLRGNPIIARKMGFPEVILSNDIRNDLYVKLIRGEFHRTAKTTERNIEVTVSVHNDRGQLLPDRGILSGGNGSAPVDYYKSVVYYHNDKPRWNDYFKISLPMNMEEFSTAHIKFTFKHRSSSDSKDRTEKPFALSYLKLKEVEGTAIRDYAYELILYKIDPKHYRESDVQYLSLPYMKTPSWQGPSKLSCPGFSCSSKDYFYVKTTLCSINFTQNADLLDLLQWVTKLRQVAESMYRIQQEITPENLVTALLESLRHVLDKVTKVSGEEIVKFLQPIFDALFLILVDPLEQIFTEFDFRSGGRQSLFGDFLNKTSLYYENETSTAASCDRSVFNCLLHIFGLILDHKYQNFQSVLGRYIEDNFSSTLAYKKLAKQLKYSIERDDPQTVLRVMKSIEFFFKFIIKSFENHKRLRYIEFGREDEDRDDEDGFEEIIKGLFKAMCNLLSRKEGDGGDKYIGAEGGCLKHIPRVIGDLIRVFPARRLSEQLVELCCNVPQNKLTNIKLTFLTEIVHSDLFMNTECRSLFMPTVATSIQLHLPGNDEELRRKSIENAQVKANEKLQKFFGTNKPFGVENVVDSRSQQKEAAHSEEVFSKNTLPKKIAKCLLELRNLPHNPQQENLDRLDTEKGVELLGDVMDKLHRQPDESKRLNISYVMQILLRPIIFSIGTIGEGDPLAGNMVGIFLSLLREMKTFHYRILINMLKGESGNTSDPYKQGLLKFLNDVLVVMKNLFHTSYFPSDWNAMILLQNSIVLTALEHFASTIKAEFADPFEEQPWNNFFICAVSFLTQPSLQLEEFSQAKQNYIIQNYEDMRKRAADIIHVMWFSLGQSKRIRFVPGMVGTFLDMALVPEAELRKTAVPIFFDMMHCEFDQDRPKKSFKEVEDELIKKIVEGLEGGKGDSAFRDIFCQTMSERCEHNNTGLKHQGLSMVSTLTTLMDLLLQYREVIHEEDSGNRMSCIVNLLDFSKEINRKELYLRYLYKLHDLHIQSKNFTEAAFTLKLHSHQLEWTDEEVPALLRVVNRHPNLVTQMELKEALYNDIITYFDTAKMWECALEICDELRQQHEESYMYSKLPQLHRQIADFYGKILDEHRFKPEYFRVAFYGGGFPSFLQDKVFVYRGRPLDQISDFEGRLLGRYLQAELLRNLGPPSDEIRYSNKQYLQICKVDPVMTTSKRLSGMKYAEENIRNYYKSNEIDKFTYSRPYHQEPKDPENEFASLCLDRYTLWISQSFPGIMSWFPVVRDTLTKIRPIENAVETLQNANETLRKLVIAHCLNNTLDLGDLTMKLNGILDAAVMGGVANYEKAFLTKEYLLKHPNDGPLVESLKQVIFIQIPILEECLKIHERRSQATVLPLHKRMEGLFKDYVQRMETTYGVNVKELKDEDLLREMSRASKQQEAKVKRLEPRDTRHSEYAASGQAGHRGSTVQTINRQMTMGASTISLYQNANGSRNRVAKSQHIFRRSTHNSFSGSMEGEQLTSIPSPHIISATLPRNATPFFNSPSFTRLAPLDSEAEGQSGGGDGLIPLTERLVSHRPPRSTAEHRKSDSWMNGDSRLSGISMGSMDTLRPMNISEPSSSSRNSVESPDSAIGDETPAPPLPPKQRERSEAPPPPPPKKPPLRQLRDA